MLHQPQGVDANLFSSFNPSYQINSSSDGTRDIEFDFSGVYERFYYGSFSDFGKNEIDFQSREENEESFGAYSISLWKTSMLRSGRSKLPPLLPQNHCYSNLSPKSRRQAIVEGRKELNEIIRKMPETCYELSLKDIVDEQHSLPAEEKIVVEDKSFPPLPVKDHIKKHEQMKSIKTGTISSGSMEGETSQIKMRFPTFLRSKTKAATAGNCSKVSPTASFDGSKICTDTSWWMKKFFAAGKTKKGVKNGISSSSEPSTRKQGNSNHLPSCWPFFRNKKSKTRRQRMHLINQKTKC